MKIISKNTNETIFVIFKTVYYKSKLVYKKYLCVLQNKHKLNTLIRYFYDITRLRKSISKKLQKIKNIELQNNKNCVSILHRVDSTRDRLSSIRMRLLEPNDLKNKTRKTPKNKPGVNLQLYGPKQGKVYLDKLTYYLSRNV